MLQDLTVESFKPHLNETFHIATKDAPLALTLTEAETVGGAPAEGARQAFSLVFRGPEDPFLEQQVYAVEHASLGRIELFMVPIGKAEDGFDYEVIFT